MEPTEKDIVIKKIMNLPPEQVSKVLVFIDALESVGDGAVAALMKGDDWKTGNQIGRGGEGVQRFTGSKTDANRFT